MPNAAAFFDMDKTLLRVESGMSWTKFLYRRGELPKRMVAFAAQAHGVPMIGILGTVADYSDPAAYRTEVLSMVTAAQRSMLTLVKQ